jgi:hypothetical protein
LSALEAPQHEDANLDLEFLTFKHPVPIVPLSPPALISKTEIHFLRKERPRTKKMMAVEPVQKTPLVLCVEFHYRGNHREI